MGQNLPTSRLGKIEWFETRTPVWQNDPTAIGLDITRAADIFGLTTQARAAYSAAVDARASAKTATQAFYHAVDTLHATGSEDIALIKAFADASDDPGAVYAAAMVSPPAPPSQAPPPAQPFDVTTTLRNDGTIEVKWKGTGPTGTRYFVHRRLAGEQAFTVVGDFAGKSFVDGGVPAGTASVSYFVVAKRGETASSPSEQVTMPLGAGNDGEGMAELSLAA